MPCPALRPWVSLYWTIYGDIDSCAEISTQTLYPCSNCSVVFQLGESVDVLDGSGATRSRPRIFAKGHFQTPFTLRFVGRFALAGIEFQRGKAHLFLRDSERIIQNRFAELEGLYGRAGERLSERLEEAGIGSPRRSVIPKLFDEFLLNYKPVETELDKIIGAAVESIIASTGNTSIATVASDVSMSVRQLQRQFKHRLGYSPRYFSRLIRFRSLIRKRRSNPYSTWPQLAYECGYFDQAHMIREFNSFTGGPPGSEVESQSVVGWAMVEMCSYAAAWDSGKDLRCRIRTMRKQG